MIFEKLFGLFKKAKNKSSDNTTKKVISIICDQLQIDEDAVSVLSNIREDLHADSLDMVEIAWAIHEKLGAEISDDELKEIKTVGDLAFYTIANAKRI